LGTEEFRSEKIPRNGFGRVSLLHRRKCSFRGIPTEELIPEARNVTELHEINLFNKVIYPPSTVIFSDTSFEIFGCRIMRK
jgi:hypothetical protein